MVKPIKISFLVLFVNVIAFGQNDSLLLKKSDFESKNKIQIGIVNDFGSNILKTFKNSQFTGLRKGIMYSRNLPFLHKNIWASGSLFYNGYVDNDANSYQFNLYSIGFDYRFPKLFNRSIYFLIGIEYAWSKREYNHFFTGGSSNFKYIGNGIQLNFSLEFGKSFFFGLSQDIGISNLYEKTIIIHNGKTEQYSGSSIGFSPMKFFAYSIGYKF